MDSTSVTAEPGGETSCTFRVRNTGMIVDQVLLDVLGDASPWATVEPSQLNMLPGTDALARVVFRPPKSSAVAAGIKPFAVRAMSTEDPGGSVIEEGAVEVTRFSDLRADIAPTKARGSRAARFKLVVQNEGNTPERVAVSVSDPDLLLEYRLKPANLVAPPGTATYVRLRTAPKRRFLKGQERPLPFQALLQGEESAPATVNGVMLQEQMLPPWLLPAIATAAVLAAALAVLWFTVLKPQVHSMATQAVNSVASSMGNQVSQANKAAQEANSAAQKVTGGGSSSSGSPSASPGSSPSASSSASPKTSTKASASPKTSTKPSPTTTKSGSGTPTATGPAPTSDLLTATAAPSATKTATFPIPANETLSVSDIVLQNPSGDSGLLEIKAGNTLLLVQGLANFRTIYQPFVQPLVFTHADPLELVVECGNTSTSCTDYLTFSGTMHSTKS